MQFLRPVTFDWKSHTDSAFTSIDSVHKNKLWSITYSFVKLKVLESVSSCFPIFKDRVALHALVVICARILRSIAKVKSIGL